MDMVCYEMNRYTNKLEKENIMPRGFKKAVAPNAALEAAKELARSIDAQKPDIVAGFDITKQFAEPKQDTIFDHVAEQNVIAAKSEPLLVEVDWRGLPVSQNPQASTSVTYVVKADSIEREEVVQNESKADSFKRLATARVNKALKYIDLVKNLSNRSVYEYQPEQVATIMKALRDQVDALEQTFTQSEKKTPTVLL